MAHVWTTTEKRFCLACFVSPDPADPNGEGDASAAFDTLGEAEDWMEQARAAGRFRSFTLWDGISGSWELYHHSGK
ncbi:hypothetical protein [Novispirillum itersonii]|uniref:hypothetical protein n=1 Tax=Novispirillum itersonii TaxID=189 RepID=UPI00036BDF31|nr:hypothetical protein [Novispirillum itersonii]